MFIGRFAFVYLSFTWHLTYQVVIGLPVLLLCSSQVNWLVVEKTEVKQTTHHDFTDEPDFRRHQHFSSDMVALDRP